MRRILAIALSFALLSLAQGTVSAQERILRFVSDVVVQQNGDLDVTETIAVQAENREIRRGIFRDFPTTYTRRSDGIRVVVGFDVQSVTRNGQPERYTTENISNGVRVRIGDANVTLPRGEHTYVIRYRTTRQIGYFDKFDELYWNATGNGWNFRIDVAEARITLPQGAQISQNASYTGAQGATGTNARVVEQTANRIVWRTTQALPPSHGLTVAAGWQKGVIAPPSSAQRASWFFQDNLPILAALAGLAGVLLYYLAMWQRVGRDPPAGTVIPLFGPPDSMTPAAVRYVDQLGMDNRAFTAAIVDLGVKGHLRLDETGSDAQVSKVEGGKPIGVAEDALRRKLFENGVTVKLEQANHKTIGGAKSALEEALGKEYKGRLFTNNYGWSSLGFLLCLVVIGLMLYAILSTRGGDEAAAGFIGVIVGGSLMLVGAGILAAGLRATSLANGWFITGAVLCGLVVAGSLAFVYFAGGPSLNTALPVLVACLLVLLAVLGFSWLQAPSVEGQLVRDKIAGFREYMSVAEEDRLNFMNPPQKTPELFEKFLPYAIALDVENAWAKKFAAVLAAAAAAGATYAWYHGNRNWSRDPVGFSSHLGTTLAATISSSASAPGSSSGSSGGGSSGGGGGGGGGGGW
jgi:uncharacterized membrane protein YgcG